MIRQTTETVRELIRATERVKELERQLRVERLYALAAVGLATILGGAFGTAIGVALLEAQWWRP